MIPQIIFIFVFTLILVALLVPVGRYRRHEPQDNRPHTPTKDDESESEGIGIGLTMLFFFLILFPLILAGSFWVGPHGPVFLHVPWVPVVSIGVILALLIAALSPRDPGVNAQGTTAPDKPVVKGVAAVFGLMYFLLLIAAVTVIVAAFV